MATSPQCVNISRSVLNSTESGDIHHHHGASAGEVSEAFKLLMTKVAPTALHNSLQDVDASKCHPGTRVAILKSLREWVITPANPYPVKWLHGSAGAGKSAIMRTLAEWLADQELLLAEFFFLESDPRRNGPQNVIATLAYQIAIAVPLSRRYIEEAVGANPLVFSLSIIDQIQTLIIAPLCRARDDAAFDPDVSPRVVLIDGLDECTDHKEQCELLQAFCQMLKDIQLPLLVLVASRPEHHLRNAFDLGDLNESSSRVALDDSFHPNADIRKFYDDKFHEMHCTHPLRSSIPPAWPSPKTIDMLVKKASGQFIYASTTICFTGSPRHNPVQRLEIILGVREAPGLQPFQQLDLLYLTILRNINTEDREQVLKLLGVILTAGNKRFLPIRPGVIKTRGLTSFWTPLFLEALLGLEKGGVRRLLLSLESLITIVNDEEDVRILHTSLSDFLFDRSRSGEFFVSKGATFTELSILTIRHACNAPYSNSLVEHYEEQLQFYMENATPSPDFREFIVQFDIQILMDRRNLIFDPSSPENPAYGVRILAPTFLQGILQSSLHGASAIYIAHLQKFSTIADQILELYQENLPLMYLATAASVSWHKTFTMAMVPFEDLCEFISLPLSSEMIKFDYSAGFDFLHPNQNPDSTPHLFEILGLRSDHPSVQVCTYFAARMLTQRPGARGFEFGRPHPNLSRLYHAVLPQFLKRSILPRGLVQLAIKELRDLDDNPPHLPGFVGMEGPILSQDLARLVIKDLRDLDYNPPGPLPYGSVDIDNESSDDSDSPPPTPHDSDNSDSSPHDRGYLRDVQVALDPFKQRWEEQFEAAQRKGEEEPEKLEEVWLRQARRLNELRRVQVWFALLGIFGLVFVHWYLGYSDQQDCTAFNLCFLGCLYLFVTFGSLLYLSLSFQPSAFMFGFQER